jgi:hypothetical protein
MGEIKKDRCGGICSSIVALFIFLILLILISNDDFIKWADKHAGLAAWVQAIFVVFTMIVAFSIASFQANKAKQLEELKDANKAKAVKKLMNSMILHHHHLIESYDNTLELHKDVIPTEEIINFLSTIKHTIEDIKVPDDELLVNLYAFGEDKFEAIIAPYKSIEILRNEMRLQFKLLDFYTDLNEKNDVLNGLMHITHIYIKEAKNEFVVALNVYK